MARDRPESEYFEWIYLMLFGGDTDVAKPATKSPTGGRRPKAGEDRSYTELLAELHRIPFRYTIPMDGNREADGINLRYRFGYEREYADYIIAQSLDIYPCSVLEMMTALAVRCEEIMERADNANLTGEWFRSMLRSLGLMEMNNACIDITAVHEAVQCFLDHEYERDGRGGLFTVSRKCDMRTVELWYQMQYWLDEQLQG